MKVTVPKLFYDSKFYLSKDGKTIAHVVSNVNCYSLIDEVMHIENSEHKKKIFQTNEFIDQLVENKPGRPLMSTEPKTLWLNEIQEINFENRTVTLVNAKGEAKSVSYQLN